jgi:DNA-binding NtrC family response regulator
MKQAKRLRSDADAYERFALERALALTNGNQSTTARLLGIGRTWLRYLLENRYPDLLSDSADRRHKAGDRRGRPRGVRPR